MNQYLCKRCLNQDFHNYDSLRRHVSRIHKINSTNFFVEFRLGGEWPLCECGCGQKVKWSHQLKYFRRFCAGHQSRVHNNWGHNPKAIRKSSETRRRQFSNGERTVWNSGLTAETDERVFRNTRDSTNTINSNPKELKRRSDMMKRQRKDGTIPTLYGPDSSQWKGGISEVNNIARSSKKLYTEWKYPILIRDGFKCKECGKPGPDLHIHHDKEQMCEIVRRHMPDGVLPMDFKFKKVIAEKIVDYHIKNKVSGITLCAECHENKHPSLNFC